MLFPPSCIWLHSTNDVTHFLYIEAARWNGNYLNSRFHTKLLKSIITLLAKPSTAINIDHQDLSLSLSTLLVEGKDTFVASKTSPHPCSRHDFAEVNNKFNIQCRFRRICNIYVANCSALKKYPQLTRSLRIKVKTRATLRFAAPVRFKCADEGRSMREVEWETPPCEHSEGENNKMNELWYCIEGWGHLTVLHTTKHPDGVSNSSCKLYPAMLNT